MRRLPLLLLPLCLVACLGPDHIEIEPVAPRLTQKGEKVRLIGKVMDRHGKVYVRERAFFSSRDPKIAAVDEHGNVVAVSSGHTVIEARNGGFRAEMPIDVDLVDRIAVGTELLTITLADDGVKVPVSVMGRDGQVRTDRALTFSSENSNIARIDPEGRIWGINPGETLVKAKVEDKIAILKVLVTEPPPKAKVAAHRR